MVGESKGLSWFWRELKRRNVIRSLAIYAGTAFIILEASTIIFPRWKFPEWSIDLVLWLLILGAIINVFIAWVFDLTPKGLQKTKPREEQAENRGGPGSKGWKAATYLSLVVIVSLIVLNIVGSPKQLHAGDIQSLLILPFDNFTGDDGLDYVAAGMHSSLIGDMGQISGLRVISKTTASIYKNQDMSLPDIATELNVGAVIEPTVMCYGDSVCIQIKVITPFPEEKQIWMGEYKEERSQILNLYNRVAKQIADEIKVSLTPYEEGILAVERTVNKEAYDAYLKGKYYWDQLTPEALQMALEYFNKAIELDPEWAPPHGGVAEFWIGVRQMGLAPSSITVPNIYNNLNKLMELDPNSAYSHYINALTAASTAYDWEKGESEFKKVMELNPNDAYNRAYYAHLLMFLKRPEEARDQTDKALKLDPLNPLIQGLAAVVYAHTGGYERSIELANQVLAMVPHHPLGINVLWMSHDMLGNYKESVRYCAAVFGLDEETSMLIQNTFETQGYVAALKQILNLVESIPDEEIPVSASVRIAWLYFKTGNVDECLNILEDRLKEQGPDLPYVTTGIALFDEIENDPRYISILENMGLPPTVIR
jgi:adenylate cyclase